MCFESNKITFKRTPCLCNAVCFKNDNNVWACTVSAYTAYILLPVVNLSLEINSATSIFFMTWKVMLFDAASSIFAFFCHCACPVSTILLLPVSNLTSRVNSANPFSYKDAVISGARHHFRCALSTLILLPVVNFSPKMYSATSIFYMT